MKIDITNLKQTESLGKQICEFLDKFGPLVNFEQVFAIVGKFVQFWTNVDSPKSMKNFRKSIKKSIMMPAWTPNNSIF